MAPLAGHTTVRKRLAEAVRAGRMPQVLLFEGAEGVGRQRLALWLAQLLFCEKQGPCGTCRGCRLVTDLGHADLHWIVPILRPKATDSDKQVDEAAELIGDIIAERRKNPLYGSLEGLAFHPLATVRLIQRKAVLKSVEGGPKVFIIGHAERLALGTESSQDAAANALLKLLEEPPANTWFILTATDAGRLLPTIQSRVVPVRLARLTDAEVRGFLGAELKPVLSGAALDDRVRLAEGSIGAAISASDAGAKAFSAAADLIDVALQGSVPRAERVLKQGPFAARGEFTAMLDALEQTLSDAARAATGMTPRRALPVALRSPRPVSRLLAAQQRVAEARETAQGNVNPQLLVAVLTEDLATCLQS
jgi:DNA polymerase III delta prime subunit